MPPILMIVLTLHSLVAAFWLVSSLVLAWSPGVTSALMFRLQMLAATVVVFAGGGLWSMLYSRAFGPAQMVVAAGAVCAIAAAGVQGGLVGGSIRRLKTAAQSEAEASRRMRLGHRVAAGLLALALLTMFAARRL